MPKRTDIKSILILGAGPIVIGQACEFDYSGTQAVRALKEEGYRVILVNSNPATIMTDPELADATYIEPVRWEEVARIIDIERPDALLPTMGGQTALNCALDLVREGVLAKYSVEMIGASRDAIDKAEDREKFRQLMIDIGLDMPRSAIAHSLEEAFQVQARLGYPAIIRPSFTMGGSGGGIAYNREEFEEICLRGLELSPTHELLIDESVLGWKEFEMEVVRDKNDNCIIICTIENLDPMGVHTGDSITVAPAQTLTDKEYQRMRDAAIKVLRAVGVDTGGSNVQFAINPEDGRMLVVEMNPRVSRSSALASKATGFPIAKVAAKLAVGYTLDELKNEITGGITPASFEPSIDYVVTKIPRFNFDKFPQTSTTLTTQMKSVGEVMAIGANFQESLQKAIRGLEVGRCGLHPLFQKGDDIARLRGHLREPTPDRLWYIADAFRQHLSLEDIYQESRVDPWFLAQIEELVQLERSVFGKSLYDLTHADLLLLKQRGFADAYLAKLMYCSEEQVRNKRLELGINPVYKRIDSCAGEFPSDTAYMYSCYGQSCEARPDAAQNKIIILGGGPNRIGQGIEFDYCCVHAAMALKEAGYQTIMINCNPETVSTDVDTSDRLYFEPVTLEDVLSIVSLEQPAGVIVHYGGQTPLKLARALAANGVPIIGTSPDAIDMAEDRERFQQVVEELKLHQPDNGTVRSEEEAIELANRIGYPLVVRPSYVLGGRAMEIVYHEADLRHYLSHAVAVSNDSPVLLDRFLNDAIEVDIDAVCDGKDVLIGAIMEHIEQAGIHSGDSACTLPPFSLSVVVQQDLMEQMRQLALKLGVVGLINAQFAIQADDIYVLEVNPRASRTVPFVSKATGLPLAKIAARCKVGMSLKEQGLNHHHMPSFYSIKLPVFPFIKFAGVDSILGPEMKSTGEVMGIAKRFGQAYAKAQLGAGVNIAKRRRAFVSVRDADKTRVGEIATRLIALGFDIIATRGTALVLQAAGVDCRRVFKVAEGRPHVVDFIKNNEIDFIVNTTEGKRAIADSFQIRRNALQHKVSYTTTLSGAEAACLAMKYEDRETVIRLQDLH
ncbi:MAG: carbamoyl-phosphate synthase large subunit [Legionella sp.]